MSDEFDDLRPMALYTGRHRVTLPSAVGAARAVGSRRLMFGLLAAIVSGLAAVQLTVSPPRASTVAGSPGAPDPSGVDGTGAAQPSNATVTPTPSPPPSGSAGTPVAPDKPTRTTSSASSTPTRIPSSTMARAALACQVSYTVQEWIGGFVASIEITNTGSTSINSWTLVFTFAGDQRVTNAWNMELTQSGAAVTAKSMPYNQVINSGQTTTMGFQATFGAVNPAPTSFMINGSVCALG